MCPFSPFDSLLVVCAAALLVVMLASSLVTGFMKSPKSPGVMKNLRDCVGWFGITNYRDAAKHVKRPFKKPRGA